MKLLVVAHPDDEILWFAPNIFDLIVIAFCDRHDKPFAGAARRQALLEHPLKDKIINLNIPEPGYWKDKQRISQFKMAELSLHSELKDLEAMLPVQMVFTHNAAGEYGHDDHVLVHNVCKTIFKQQIYCPLFDSNKQEDLKLLVDRDLFFSIKAVYDKHKVWTWRQDYKMPKHLSFAKL